MQYYFKLRPSRQFLALLALLYLGVLVSLWLLPLSWIALFLMSIAMTYGAIMHLVRDARLVAQKSCVAFRLERGDGIVLILRDGTHLPGCLASDSLVTPFLLILNVKLDEARGGRSIRILPDAMGRDSFRRLRVALRWRTLEIQAGV